MLSRNCLPRPSASLPPLTLTLKPGRQPFSCMFRNRPDWSPARQAELASGAKADCPQRFGAWLGQVLAEENPPGRLGGVLETALQAAGDRFRAPPQAELEPAASTERPSCDRARPRVELWHRPASDDRLLFAATGGKPPTGQSAVLSGYWHRIPAFSPLPPPSSATPPWTHLILIPRQLAWRVPTRAGTVYSPSSGFGGRT